MVLLSTVEPDKAWQMFDDGTYPRSMQGQFAQLSSPVEGPTNVGDEYALLSR